MPGDVNQHLQAITDDLVGQLANEPLNPTLYHGGLFLIACARLAKTEKLTDQVISRIFEPLKAQKLLSKYPSDATKISELLSGCQWNRDVNIALNSVLALDAIQQFKDADPPPRSESMFVPLILKDNAEMAQLTVELIMEGHGEEDHDECLVYKNPRYMLFQVVKEDMEESFTLAAAHAKKHSNYKGSPHFRWRINIPGNQLYKPTPLKGPSAAGAFAICAAKLLSGEPERNQVPAD